MVEKRWRTACKTENDRCNSDDLTSSVSPVLPNDSELATAFVERKKRLVEIVITFLVQKLVRKLFLPPFLKSRWPSCSVMYLILVSISQIFVIIRCLV